MVRPSHLSHLSLLSVRASAARADVARGVPNRRLRRLVTDVASGLGGEPDAVPAWWWTT